MHYSKTANWKKAVNSSGKQIVVLAGVLAVMLIAAVVAVIDNYYIGLRGDELKRRVEYHREMVGVATELRDLAVERLILLQGLLISEDPFERDELVIAHRGLAGEFIGNREALGRMVEAFRPYDEEAGQHADFLVSLDRVVGESAEIQTRVRSLALEGQLPRARALMAAEGHRRMSAITDHLSRMLNDFRQNTETAVFETTRFNERTIRRIVYVSVGVLLLSSIVGLSMVRQIARSERRLVAEVDARIATQRQLEEHRDQLEVIVGRRTAALAESEARTTAILQTAPDGIVTMDREGRLATFNPAAEEVFGYSAGQLLGRSIDAIIVPKYREAFVLAIKRCADDEKSSRCGPTLEIEGLRGDGSVFPVEIRIGKVGHEGQVMFTAVIRDVSERKSLENQLLQAQKLESVGQLAAGIAHEINTPTQYVSDNVQYLTTTFDDLLMLLERYEQVLAAVRAGDDGDRLISELEEAKERADLEFLLEETPGALRQAKEGLGQIGAIVGAMKEFSHPGSGELETVDVNQLIKNTLLVTKNEWKYVATVAGDLADGLPCIQGMRGKLGQVLLNIVVNAAQAIAGADGDRDRGGVSGVISVSTRSREGFVEIRICDNGPGIPPEIRERVFDPFFTTKEVGKGTGQGLAISHSVIAELHKGRIAVVDNPGGGACFVIHLPIVQGDAVTNGKGNGNGG